MYRIIYYSIVSCRSRRACTCSRVSAIQELTASRVGGMTDAVSVDADLFIGQCSPQADDLIRTSDVKTPVVKGFVGRFCQVNTIILSIATSGSSIQPSGGWLVRPRLAEMQTDNVDSINIRCCFSVDEETDEITTDDIDLLTSIL
jgi:hypothetical protein